MKKKLLAGLVGGALLGSAAVATAMPASAGTDPYGFDCSVTDGADGSVKIAWPDPWGKLDSTSFTVSENPSGASHMANGALSFVDDDGTVATSYTVTATQGDLSTSATCSSPTTPPTTPTFKCTVTSGADGTVKVGWNDVWGRLSATVFKVTEAPSGASQTLAAVTSVVDATPSASYTVEATYGTQTATATCATPVPDCLRPSTSPSPDALGRVVPGATPTVYVPGTVGTYIGGSIWYRFFNVLAQFPKDSIMPGYVVYKVTDNSQVVNEFNALFPGSHSADILNKPVAGLRGAANYGPLGLYQNTYLAHWQPSTNFPATTFLNWVSQQKYYPFGLQMKNTTTGELRNITVCLQIKKYGVTYGTPIALDLNRDGKIGTTTSSTARDAVNPTITRTVSFDLFGDGTKSQISWFNGDGDGVLVDNRDGKAATHMDGNHLFGNAGGYDNGYLKLATLDTNKDGVVSGTELRGLLIWVDNGDGKVQPGEFRSVRAAGVTSLNTTMSMTEGLMRSTATVRGQNIMTEDVWFSTK